MPVAENASRSLPWYSRMGRIDRRIIFVLIALSVAVPLLLKMTFPIHASPIVQRAFDQIDALPPGSRVMLSLDFGPATAPENFPMAAAIARHVLARQGKLFIMSLWATGQGQSKRLVEDVLQPEFPNLQDGVDWMNLGYRAGNQGLINAILIDLKAMYSTDASSRSTRDIPMLKEVRNLTDMALIVGIGSGVPGVKEWIQFAGDRGNIPIVGGVTAVEAPLLYPYYPQQLVGLMGGLQGAAEYEAELVRRYPQFEATGTRAVKLMGPQAVAHTLILLFVAIGNLSHFLERRRERQGNR